MGQGERSACQAGRPAKAGRQSTNYTGEQAGSHTIGGSASPATPRAASHTLAHAVCCCRKLAFSLSPTHSLSSSLTLFLSLSLPLFLSHYFSLTISLPLCSHNRRRRPSGSASPATPRATTPQSPTGACQPLTQSAGCPSGSAATRRRSRSGAATERCV